MKTSEKHTRKILALVLSVPLLCGAVALNLAERQNAPKLSFSFESLKDSVACFSARLSVFFMGGNKMEVPTAAPSSDKTTPAGEIPEIALGTQAIQTEAWRCTELVFKSGKEYEDPFSDVTLNLFLIGDGRQRTIPCFWDGENVWKARVACPSAGTWYYKTVCSDETDAGLHDQTGWLECREYGGTLEVYKHGFPTTDAGKKNFTYADGTPFFYLGDTHWSLGDETPKMVKEISAKRAAQGFTVWQSEPIGEKFDLTDGVTDEDLEGFRDFDEKFRIIADAGLTHANAQFFFSAFMDQLIEKHGGFSGDPITGTIDGKEVTVKDFSNEAKTYLEYLSRYWVARYGAYPVMWTLGQEVDNDFYWNETTHPVWNALNNPYKLVAAYIAKYDAYGHPLSAHQENAALTAAYGNGLDNDEPLTVYSRDASSSAFRNVSAHSFYAAQWSPVLYGSDESGIPKDYWYNSQGKPSVNYEGRYCYLWTKNFGARAQGWMAYLNGMYGYGWGGQDTWSYLNPYGENEDSDDGVDTVTADEKQAATWRDALDYPSTYQTGYMRSFLEDGKWWELIPRFDDEGWFMPHGGVYGLCAANEDRSEIVLYFYSFADPSVAERPNTDSRGGKETGTLGHLKPLARYEYQWYDPISGEYGRIGAFRASALGTYCIGEKPTATDWALRITPAPLPFGEAFGEFTSRIFSSKQKAQEVDDMKLPDGDFIRIFPDMGVCDPHVHIYNGKAWLFSSHDRGPGQPIFRMDDWRIFSSDDLVNWKLEATVHPEDTFLGQCEECYAVDSAERNGKYYFYFSQQQYQTGVMVSEKGPAGPYKDALGAPLLPPRLAETPSYDPTVFIDDDENQTPYIMWGYTLGADHYYIARLNEDMISLAEEPKMVEIENGWQNDACWISKFGGVYYLNSHEGDYATSDNIYGPYTYRGKICQDCFTDHGTFFTFHNQLYFTYAVPENFGSDEPLDRYYRTMKIVYAHLKDNGEIVTDDFIKKVGVGQYNAKWDEIRGEWFFDASDGIVKKENDDGFELRGIVDGMHLTFPNIKNMPENATLRICVSNGNDTPCTVEVRKENEKGKLLGTCTVGNTGGFDKYQTFDIGLKNNAGTLGLCFVFRSDAPEALRFDMFSFIENTGKDE